MEPACLRSPLLAHWAGLVAAACRFLELDCHATAGCDAAWLPLSLAAAVILLAAVAGAAAWRWLAAAQARDGARIVAVAAAVLKELRKAAPQQYPGERHMFMAAAEGSLPADPLQPLLCAVCLGPLGPAGGGPPPAAQACAACGTLAHDSCVRRAGKTCRPLCCGGAAGDHGRQQHFWQAWGTILDEESAAADGSPTCLYCQEPAETDGLIAAEPLWRCSLCGDACHVSCFAEAHPQLPTVAAKLHALLDGKKHGGHSGRSGRASPQRAQQARRARGGEAGGSSAAGSSPSGDSSDDGERIGLLSPAAPVLDSTPALTEPSSAVSDSSAPEGLRQRRGGGGTSTLPGAAPPAATAAGEAAADLAGQQARPRSSSWLQALGGVVSWRGSSSGGTSAGAGPAAGGAGMDAAGMHGAMAAGAAAAPDDSGYSSDSESDDEFDARLQRQRWQRRRRRRLAAHDIAHLDTCTLGPNRRSVLPPTAVRLASRSREGSETGLAEGAAAAAATAGGGAGGGTASQQQAQQADGRVGAADTAGAAGAAAAGGTKEQGGGKEAGEASHKRGSSWWRRMTRKKGLQWSDYRIEQLPPGCKPVLVFVNTKSGPQVGTSLRQRFLRALHPLQVVELPRQKPDAALQLFAPVAAHIRILVVGGDGSVAWVLSTLEDVRAQQAAAGNPHWKPPPVAVLPLGTGNDLARCLGWGSGHGVWRQEGVATMLSEVQHAAPLHIDRWDVAFAPPRPAEAPTTPRGKLATMLQRGGSLALSGFGHAHHPSSGGGSSGSGGGSGGGSATAAVAAAAAGPPPVVKQMQNYLGIGVDAKVALDFHQMREQLPFFFTSQLGNKFWYTTIGGVDIVSGHALGSSACVNLAQKLQVVCDGCPVALPADIEGLLVCNINSYMGGVDLWRNSYSLAGTGMLRRGSSSASASGGGGGGGGGGVTGHRHSQQSTMDGKVEIVAVYGSWHLGQLQVGLSRAVRLGQGSEVVISTIKPLPMQVDGEPFVQAPCVVHISRRGQGLVLRRVQSKPLAKMMQALSEVLEESEHRGTITPAQHHALMAELSSRLQPLLLHPA